MTIVDEPPQDPFEPIAVIGVAALFPDAPDLDTFWDNILSAKVSLKEVPDGRWDVDERHTLFRRRSRRKTDE